MNCKFCQQELEDGVTLCPNCGRENAEETAEATVVVNAEKTGEDPKPGMGKFALALGILVALLVLLAAMIMGGKENTDTVETEGSDQNITELTETTEATEPPTTPADTGLNDATCKGSYTVTDEELLANLDTVVATMGEEVMTVEDLQVYYWLQVRDFLSSEDFYYLYYYYGYINPAVSLDCQICYYDETLTWQQYFIGEAISAWQEFTAMAVAAKENGVEMEENLRTDLEGMEESLTTVAVENGFATAEELLKYNMGPGATMEAYKKYLEVYYLGYSYYSQQYEAQAPTDEEAIAYFEENLATFEEQGITKDSRTVDVRHVLIMPEGGTTDPATGATTYTDEEWAAAETKAQALLDAWVAEGATEEAFAEMAKEHSADGNAATGGLYEGVYVGQMVDTYNDWCFDESRQVGDYGLVQTQFGWHIMYFSGVDYVWQDYAAEEMLYNRITELMDAAINKYELTVDYSKLILGYIDLSA